MNKFDKIPSAERLILRGDDRIEKYREDTMMRGDPDAVLLARDEKDVKDAIKFCGKNLIPITFCGSQTSMTGSSVATEGLLVSTEKLAGVADIGGRKGAPFAIVRPGTVVADLQKKIDEMGYFYPVAPTSRDECLIGANVSTNATGEDSFKYGPTRFYVESLRIFLADGKEKILKRAPDEAPPDSHNRGGYCTNWKNPIDLIIGSEGTLAFIAEVTLRLLPKPPDFFSALVPFPSNRSALECLVKAVHQKTSSLRTLEYIDSGALAAMKTTNGFPSFPKETMALLYFKLEYKNENDKNSLLESLHKHACAFTTGRFADSIIIADSPKQKEAFRLLRHRIPEWANEEGRKFWAKKGGKVGSDWWVPIEHLLEMMDFFYKEALSSGLPHMAYAHLGRGHPHTNLFAKTDEEWQRAHAVLLRCCRKAVLLGGGVSGEHGIGKIHKDLMPIQYSNAVLQKMRGWKKEYDPSWILGRGNIFDV